MAVDGGGPGGGERDPGELSAPSVRTPDPSHGKRVFRTPLAPDRQALALTETEQVAQFARYAPQWLTRLAGRDTIEQELWMAVLTAAADFDPVKNPGVPFGAFARQACKWCLLNLRRDWGQRQSVWQGMPTNDECQAMGDELPDHRPLADSPAFHAWFDEDYKRQRRFLDWRSRIVLYLRYVEGWTLEEVGDALGVSRERVRQVEGKAGRKLAAARSRDQLRKQLAGCG